jgi:2,4'-dihydroxyacetophenone dioxygenase
MSMGGGRQSRLDAGARHLLQRARLKARMARRGVPSPRRSIGTALTPRRHLLTESTDREFWRDLKPIEEVFRPGAGEDVYIGDAPTAEERYYVPFSDTVSSRPLWISPTQNRWCDILYSKGPGLVNRHYHPHQVFAYTISGKWGYLEHDWVATAGDFVYESPGEGHTLVAYDHPDPMKVHFNVTGPLIWIDENGESVGRFDVFDYIELCKDHYDQVGVGADYVDKLYR